MRALNPACLRPARLLVLFALLGLLVAPATPAHAMNVVKGDGYRVQLPDGYVAMDLPGGLLSSAQAQIAGRVPTTGVPTLEVYLRGDAVDPESVIVLSRVDLKMGAWSKDALEDIRADARGYQAQLGQGVNVQIRKTTVAGRLDALEVDYEFGDSELRGQIGGMRYLVTSNGGFLFVLMLMAGPHADPTLIDEHWSTLTTSLHVSSTATPMNKLLLWAGLGLAGMILLLLLYRAFDNAAVADGRAPPVAVAPGAIRPADGLGYGGAGAGGHPPQAAPPGLRQTGPAGTPEPGLRPTGPSRPQPRPQSPARSPGTAGAAGLKSTLPPSGRWSQD